MKPITTIQGAWSDEDNAWVSETLQLTGDAWLEVELPSKGRMVIKKAEQLEGPWPKALKTPWTQGKFRIRIYGTTKWKYIRIYLTETPKTIQYANI